jgi:hypothetical protein
MKETFSVESTVNARIASARVLALGTPVLSLETTPFGRDEADAEEGAGFVLTRSAHDFGSALGAGAGVDSSDCVEAVSVATVSELLAVSELGEEPTAGVGGASLAAS